MLRRLFVISSLGLLCSFSSSVRAAPAAAAPAAGQPAATASPAAEPSAKPPAKPAAPGAVSTQTATVQLKDLEQRVNNLKERVFRSKARLNLLKETVLHGVIAGSRAVIKHKNEMGGSFTLVRVVYALDGAEMFSRSDEGGGLDEKREFEVFNGSIVPGEHTLAVHLVYRGHGMGVFSYLEGYEFNVRSSHVFTAAEGRQIVLTVRSFEKGDFTTELQDRPAISFQTSIYKVGASPDGKKKSSSDQGENNP